MLRAQLRFPILGTSTASLLAGGYRFYRQHFYTVLDYAEVIYMYATAFTLKPLDPVYHSPIRDVLQVTVLSLYPSLQRRLDITYHSKGTTLSFYLFIKSSQISYHFIYHHFHHTCSQDIPYMNTELEKATFTYDASHRCFI